MGRLVENIDNGDRFDRTNLIGHCFDWLVHEGFAAFMSRHNQNWKTASEFRNRFLTDVLRGLTHGG